MTTKGLPVDIELSQDFIGEVGYRVGIYECPYCDFKSDYRKMTEDWLTPSAIREVALSADARQAKTDSVKISSECPKCFKKSFHHVSFNFVESLASLDNWPKFLSEAIAEEKRKRLREARREWDRSLCKTCSVKRKVSWDACYAYIECSIGLYGRPQQKGDCDEYKKKRKRKK